MPTKTPAMQAEAIEQLRGLLPRGAVVYTILRDVAKSGMSRRISLAIVDPDSKDGKGIRTLDWLAAKALDMRVNTNNKDGIQISGCGMDMGFQLVYDLSKALHKREDMPEQGDGYALNHRWL